jgi:dolichol-phosphate mannosyltransferase
MEIPDFAVVVPMANEAPTFNEFTRRLAAELDKLKSGKVYMVVDDASKDRTKELCEQLSSKDLRFVSVYDATNKNVVDAYLRGYKEAFKNGHALIIEMDAGLSHDPIFLPRFIEAFQNGYHCIFGSRFMQGGSMQQSGFLRWLLSSAGTTLSNSLLGTRLNDMTSGYQGFSREIVKKILSYGLRSKAHFYQTEIRYLLRRKKFIEIPITYHATSPGVSFFAIRNSISLLLYYFMRRISFNSAVIQ